jgi:hypothetical protein
VNPAMSYAVDASKMNAASTVAALVDSLLSEAKLLGDLANIMRHQRESVAHDDLQGVDDSVFSTHRVLVTLQEARRRRRAINHVLGESDDLSVVALEEFFNGELPPSVAEASTALRQSAMKLQNEVSVNRRVLKEAIAAGDRQGQMLVGAAGGAKSSAEAPSGGRRLIDRMI